jgi:RNA polymerase sigma-54 factor
VRQLRNGYAVELNQATLPRLLVNRRYYQELKSGPQDKTSRAWLSECLASANWLVKALDPARADDRQGRVGNSEAPRRLLRARRFGDEATDLREVADAIEMHESTVSRVTSNKYLLCDRGLMSSNISSARASRATAATAPRPRRSSRGSGN